MPTPQPLSEPILEALSRGPRRAADLASELHADPQEVQKVCRSLQRQHKVLPLDSLDLRILRAIRENAGTVPEITERLHEKRETVYRRCRRLQDKGHLLTSELAEDPDRRLFFFPVTGQVLQNTTYEHIGTVLDHLRTIARKHNVTPGTEIPEPVKQKLRADYRRYLNGLATTLPPKQQQQLRSFQAELMEVLNHTTISDVLSLLGLRSFAVKVRQWEETVAAKLGIAKVGVPMQGVGLGGDVMWWLIVDGDHPSQDLSLSGDVPWDDLLGRSVH